jgi:hypothetical protein
VQPENGRCECIERVARLHQTWICDGRALDHSARPSRVAGWAVAAETGYSSSVD